MKRMDFSKFKKVKSDENCSTFRHTDDGHELKIAHSKLTPKLRKQLEEVPHYAEGGEVEDPEEKEERSFSKDFSRAIDTIKNVANDYAPEDKTPKGADFASQYNAPAESAAPVATPEPAPIAGPAPASVAPPVVEEAAPPVPQATLAPTPAPAPVAAVPNAGAGLMGTANQYAAGAAKEAKAIGQQGMAEAAIRDEQIKAQEHLIQSFQQNSQKAMGEIDAVMEDYRKQHINPNRYMESQTSGQKVQTAIGLILSGFGSGLARQENMAAKFLDEQIKRDIAAQEKELGKTENLLSFNLTQYGNMKDALTMTEAMQKGLYAAKLEKAASLSKDPIAQARAMQAAAKFKAEILPNIQKLASSQATASLMNMGTKTERDFQAKINALGAANPEMAKEMRERYIPGIGVANVKPTDKDREALSRAKPVLDALTELQAIAATMGTTVPGSDQDIENKAKVANLQLDLKGPAAFDLGQIAGADKDFMDAVVKDPGSLRTSAAIKSLEATKKSVMARYNANLKKVGITPFEGGADPMEGRTATNAKGQKIVMKNGQWVPYGG